MQPILTVEDLAKYIHKSASTIRSDVKRNPHSLPPICRLPGTRRLLWRSEDVEAWLVRFVNNTEKLNNIPIDLNVKRRGRPTRSEQISKKKLSPIIEECKSDKKKRG
jgi:predicted DNA-binding transcriptional regulator AlpA